MEKDIYADTVSINVSDDEITDIFNKKKNYVYLAGSINQNPRTYGWREEFEELVKDEEGLVVVNPCANRYNQAMRTATGTGMAFLKEAVKRSQYLLRSKDYQLISICNLLVVDLVTGTEERPLIGTLFELDWARKIFDIPIIAITHNQDTPYTNHPWITEYCSSRVETMEEAVDIIKTFFLEY